MNLYFRKPLKQFKLFLDLWGILQTAFYSDTGLIQREFPMRLLKEAFEKALKRLHTDTESNPHIQELVNKVEDQREADRRQIKATVVLLSNQSMAPTPQ